MAIAGFKDLCVDAENPRRLGQFWATALNLTLISQENGNVKLDGGRPTERVWVNAVPEPKTVKHRVHLDVPASAAHLESLGATVLRSPDDEIRWTVMADVEGGEFCAFDRADARCPLVALVIDAVDARSQARWWADVLGARVTSHPNGWHAVVDIPGAPFEEMLFIPVPEPKTVKNRVHWDLESDNSDAIVQRGAHVLREPGRHTRWRVLADPEDNEFCVFDASS